MKDAMKKAKGLFDAYNRHDSVMHIDQFVESIALAITEAYEQGARENKTADSYFERIKEKARAEERKSCAKVAENYPQKPYDVVPENFVAICIAKAIRSRSCPKRRRRNR
jgi:hypothetical protein